MMSVLPRRSLTLLALLFVATMMRPTPAAAQMRPFQGLFGSDPDRQQQLGFTFSLYGGYDDNVVGTSQSGGSAARAAQVGSGLAGFGAGFDYAKSGRRWSFGTSLDAGARYFAQASQLSAASYGAGLGASYQLTRYTRVNVSQAVSFQPRYQLGLIDAPADPVLGESIPSNLDYTVAKRESLIYRTNVDVSRQLGRRTNLGLNYSFRKQDFRGTDPRPPDEPITGPIVPPLVTGDPTDVPLTPSPEYLGTYRDVTIQSGGFGLRHTLTRNAALHLGYIYNQAVYPSPQERIVRSHILDVGADYSRAFTPARRTTFSFSTGSWMVQRRGQQLFRLTGNAALNHQFARNWAGRITYRRGYGFLGAFEEPYFTDTVTGGISANLSRRLRWQVLGAYTSGQVGLEDRPNTGVKTTSGSTSVDYAFTPLLSAYGQYIYYRYEFQEGVALPFGLDRQFDRQGVRAGLTLRLPLIQ